jgi:two-component system, chemotaxis family, chemotaxis protein CheY
MQTIMTVDDSLTLRLYIQNCLERYGYMVIQAHEGEYALKSLETDHVDLIITDINMPGMDGLRFIEELRKKEKHQATPIVILSEESNPIMKRKAKEANVLGWVVKPIQEAALIGIVRKALPQTRSTH